MYDNLMMIKHLFSFHLCKSELCVCRANKQIAEVRTKLGAEVSALQVQLRREQLKVQSLEKNLEQKVFPRTEIF